MIFLISAMLHLKTKMEVFTVPTVPPQNSLVILLPEHPRSKQSPCSTEQYSPEMCWHVCASRHCQSAAGRSPVPRVYPSPLRSASSQGNLKGHVCNLGMQLHTLSSPGTPPSHHNTQQCCAKAQKSGNSNCQSC